MAEPLAIAKGLMTLKGAFDKHFETQQREWLEKCRDEAIGVAQAVAIGVLSALLGRHPRDSEVQDLLAEITTENSFPARSLRLLSEVVRSPAEVRRRRLAAVLIAGPKISASEADRDRLDMLMEQLLEEDIRTLDRVARLLNGREVKYAMVMFAFDVWYMSAAVGIVKSARKLGHDVSDGVFEDCGSAIINRYSLERLEGAGCVVLESTDPVHLQVTGLGDFLWRQMNHEAIRTAVGSGDADEAE